MKLKTMELNKKLCDCAFELQLIGRLSKLSNNVKVVSRSVSFNISTISSTLSLLTSLSLMIVISGQLISNPQFTSKEGSEHVHLMRSAILTKLV